EAGARSVAFPCISTGVYGYPKPTACDIAVRTVSAWLSTHTMPESVTFCCFSAEDVALYRAHHVPAPQSDTPWAMVRSLVDTTVPVRARRVRFGDLGHGAPR